MGIVDILFSVLLGVLIFASIIVFGWMCYILIRITPLIVHDILEDGKRNDVDKENK